MAQANRLYPAKRAILSPPLTPDGKRFLGEEVPGTYFIYFVRHLLIIQLRTAKVMRVLGYYGPTVSRKNFSFGDYLAIRPGASQPSAKVDPTMLSFDR